MCYDIKTQLKTQLKRALHHQDEKAINDIKEKLGILSKDYFHTSGFAHPKIIIYDSKKKPIVSSWGLVPSWVTDQQGKQKIQNATINARLETIFEKPSFKTSAKYGRGFIDIDGFYEHHHTKDGVVPYFIYHENNHSLTLACLISEWTERETQKVESTFTLVTTKANALLQKIHNNPKLAEPRMPLILDDNSLEYWCNPSLTSDDLLQLTTPNNVQLQSYRVKPLRGKLYVGNTSEVSEKID